MDVNTILEGRGNRRYLEEVARECVYDPIQQVPIGRLLDLGDVTIGNVGTYRFNLAYFANYNLFDKTSNGIGSLTFVDPDKKTVFMIPFSKISLLNRLQGKKRDYQVILDWQYRKDREDLVQKEEARYFVTVEQLMPQTVMHSRVYNGGVRDIPSLIERVAYQATDSSLAEETQRDARTILSGIAHMPDALDVLKRRRPRDQLEIQRKLRVKKLEFNELVQRLYPPKKDPQKIEEELDQLRIELKYRIRSLGGF